MFDSYVSDDDDGDDGDDESINIIRKWVTKGCLGNTKGVLGVRVLLDRNCEELDLY